MGFVRRSAAICFAACCLVTAPIFHCPNALADNISIDVFVEARDREVIVRLTNVGRDTASSLSVSLELLGNEAVKSLPPLAPRNYLQAVFEVEYPKKEGSYPLYTTVNYLNDGRTMSLVNVGAYHYGKPRVINRELKIPDLVLRKQAALIVSYDTAYKLRLMLPREIEVLREEDVPGGKKFSLKNNRPSFNSDYTIFAALLTPEDAPEGGLKIATANLKAREYSDVSKPLSSPFYFLLAVLGYLGACFFYKKAALYSPPPAPKVALIRSLFSISVVSLLYFGFSSLHVLPDHFSATIPNACLKIPVFGAYLSQAASVLLRWLYFEGKDYDYFSKYVALPLYLYMLIGNYFVLRYIVRPEPKTDKYWHLMLSCFSLTPWIRRAIAKNTKNLPYLSSQSKVALLTLMVKAFYVPLLTSWSINNIIHQGNLIKRFDWSFHEVNEFLVALFILVDVVIFAFGYLT